VSSTDYYGRCTPEEHWAYLAPDMYEKLWLWTDEELLKRVGDEYRARVLAAKPGDWIGMHDGIAVRLREMLVPEDDEP